MFWISPLPTPARRTWSNTLAEWKALLDIDILGLVSLIEAAQPFLEAAAAKVSAVASYKPSTYGAMKGALIQFHPLDGAG
jgi:hypothetical protein